MQKHQIIVTVASILGVVCIGMLPKVVVNNDKKNIQTEEKKEAVSTTSTSSSNAESSMHNANPNDVAHAHHWLAQYRSKGDAVSLDSLITSYQSINKFDSAAFYAGEFASQKEHAEHLIKAGDAYYQAFSFSMDRGKAGELAEKARNFYQKAIDQHPKTPADIKAKLAMTYIPTNTPMQGIKILKEILEKEPQHRLALLNLGLLSMQSGQHDKAVERFKKLIEINKKDYEAAFYLGATYVETAQSEKAIEVFEAILENSSDPALKASAQNYLKQLKQ